MRRTCVLILLVLVLIGCSPEPESFEELMIAGKKAFIDEQYAEARGYLGRAVAEQPSDHDALYYLGLSYSRDFLLDSAYFFLSRANVLYPQEREINLELLTLARALKDNKSAIRAIRVLIATGDPERQYYETLASLYSREHNLPNAYHYVRLLLKSEPENIKWSIGVAMAASNIDSVHISLRVLDSAIEKFGPLPELRSNRATFLVAANKFAEAEQEMRELHAEDTTSIPYRINLANVLATQDDQQKKEEALGIYQSLLSLDLKDFKIDSLISELEKELEP
ncbi:MAG: hypothetical protein KOO62_06595 [candidate division Zixibacteria bacterium]|nr:hypothetical protein [candidate division Zixibacteria bacterium]